MWLTNYFITSPALPEMFRTSLRVRSLFTLLDIFAVSVSHFTHFRAFISQITHWHFRVSISQITNTRHRPPEGVLVPGADPDSSSLGYGDGIHYLKGSHTRYIDDLLSSRTPILLKTRRTFKNANTEVMGLMDFSFPRPFVPRTQWTFRSLDDSFPGPFIPWTFRSLDVSFHGPATL